MAVQHSMIAAAFKFSSATPKKLHIATSHLMRVVGYLA